MVLMATVCATIIGGSGLVGRAGVAYSSGTKAILTAVPYLLGMFLFAGYSGRISDIGREYGITSIPDLFERRFGKAAKLILAAMVAFTMMGTVASQVTATSGLFGVVYTDVLQFYMLLIFVYILIPIASLKTVVGFSGFVANLDPELIKPYFNGSIADDIVT
jgi:solute:Na+ symporter, SSS family